MVKQAGRSIIYSFVKSAIDDFQQHMRSAYDHAFVRSDIDNAIDRCYRAISAYREAEEHIVASRSIISAKQKKKFDKELAAAHKCLWSLTKEISNKAKPCYVQYEKSRGLRQYFLAYSYDPHGGVESQGADIASLH